MASLEEIRSERLKKLEVLCQAGMDPYPAKSDIDINIGDALSAFDGLAGSDEVKTIGGRIMALRVQGGLAFFDLYDGTGRMQGMLKKDDLSEAFDLFVGTIDIGDFIQVSGKFFVTKRGEKTIEVSKWKILSKSLRSLPDKWAGLQDPEEKLRRRYLDILLNDDVREMVIKRGVFWQAVRNFMLRKGFIEVETPVLENTAGGADAKPFVTHHNALDLDVYLRISTGELWQKKLMIAGLPKTFEIGRQFRNEGMDAEHLQDYTQMEFYWAYSDFEKGMQLVEEMYKEVAQETFGTLKFNIGDFEVDLGKKWERYDYRSTVLEKTGVDILTATLPEIEAKLKELGVDYDKKGFNITRGIDNLWKYCRKQIVGPGFLVGTPITVSPLAKRDEKNAQLAQRFQPIIAGSELGNGYSELNDPQDQLERFNEQTKLREAGDEEAQMKDEEFVEALEYGMPPTCGYGMSERVFAFLANKSARDAQIFPLMRPKDLKSTRSKDFANNTAVVVVNKQEKLEEWQIMNIVAHLNASFAARHGRELLYQDKIKTKDDRDLYLNIQNAIVLKETNDNVKLLSVMRKSDEEGLEVYEFIRPMIETSDDKKIIDYAKDKNWQDVDYMGALIFGKRSSVEEATKDFPLLK